MRVHPAVWVVLVAAAAWIGLRRFERAMIFVPSRDIVDYPSSVGLAYDRLWLTAADGTRLRAWWIPGPTANAPVLLCMHGNGDNVSARIDKMKIFHDAGAAQLWVEWRGYGRSFGTPDEAGLYRDGMAAWDWLTQERAIPATRILLYGESLGCAVAIELATRVPTVGLIIESGFSSIADMGRVVLPWMPPALESIRFDNISKLPRIGAPKLFLHSPQDDVVPYEQALRNYAAAAEPKKFLELKGSHNDGFLEIGPAYGRTIHEFLAGTVR